MARSGTQSLHQGWFPRRLSSVLAVLLLCAYPAWAADTTAPTTPVVTDDGTYTNSTSQLHASWTSSDPESGIAEYQYRINYYTWYSSGVLVDWTSTGTNTTVTKTGLSLSPAAFYFDVKAKNGDGLWSLVGTSDGIGLDTTAPSAPGQPKEGSSADLDYDDNGSYTIYWSAASDGESWINGYEIQERIGPTGAWSTLTNTLSGFSTSYAVSGRLDRTQYFYQVRAKNGAGTWGAWSAVSDGLLVDKTAPSVVTVTDDGASQTSTASLHATWTSSADAESGVIDYQYLIRQDSTSGTIIVNWTSVGLATSVTRTGLSLTTSKTYFIRVRSKNGAGLFSTGAYSDGILIQAGGADTTPPTGSITINGGATATQSTSVTLTLSASDSSGVSQMQFSNDNVTYSAAEAYATSKAWTIPSGDGAKTVYVKYKDTAGNWSNSFSDSITLDTVAPTVAISSPADGTIVVP